MKISLDYEDVALVPRMSTLATRKDAIVTATMGGTRFKIPVVPSNMRCVIDEDRAKWMSENDYMYVMHRFDVSNYNFVKKAMQENWNTISISVGVKQDDYDLISCFEADDLRVDFITIDIAHGHSLAMKKMIRHIKSKLPNTFIIAGNVCTPEGFDDLAYWGARAIKVGIGPGAACITKLKTGFTYPMYSCIKNIVENSKTHQSALLIADGGIKHNGDIAKAIHAGADWIMCGKMFSECIDSPAPKDNLGHKLYYGSASTHNKNNKNNIEGTMIAIPANNMSYKEKLQELQEDLQSSVSYAGGRELYEIRKVEAINVQS